MPQLTNEAQAALTAWRWASKGRLSGKRGLAPHPALPYICRCREALPHFSDEAQLHALRDFARREDKHVLNNPSAYMMYLLRVSCCRTADA